ncbi:MAG TPA: BTAD domain-containing putative transcriptional regulator [Candidatus Baltobacteraceae bacterium]
MSVLIGQPAQNEMVRLGDACSRPRLFHWLERHADARLRLIAAPAGSGKSTLLRDLKERGTLAAILTVGKGESAESLRERIAAALELPAANAATFATFHDALAGAPAITLGIDTADGGSDELVDELNALFETGPDHVRFVVAARSRRIARNARIFVEGAAVRVPSTLLRFTVSELAELCDRRNVPYTAKDLTTLLSATDGWATVTAACVRFAAQSGCSIGDSATRWLAEHRATFAEYVHQEVAHTSHSKVFSRLVSAGVLADIDDLSVLERDGVFVEANGSGFELMKIVRTVFSTRSFAHGSNSNQHALPMTVTVLGEFTASVAGRRVEWMRRRDAQIFKYVLLKPTGRASRGELLAAFWPDRDRQQALQALRTSCSNIRQALRDAVGTTAANDYFRADGDVTVPAESFIIDLHRFTSYAGSAAVSLANGDLGNALSNYKAAYELYRGPLLVDVPNCHYAHLAKSVDETFEELAQRLRGLQAHGKIAAELSAIVKHQQIAKG